MRTPLVLAGLLACGSPDTSETTSQDTGTSSTSTPAGTTSAGAPSGTSSGTPTGSTTPTGADYRLLGPYAVTSAESSVPVDSCAMDVTTFLPDGGTPPALVVLSHGFQRNRTHVSDLANHLASWGLAVATPKLCHSSALDADHAQNAIDVQDLADALRNGTPVIYMGHSAGGLATYLAAAADPNAIAHFGLDPVDSAGLGTAADGTHTVPTFGLVGEPGICNSQGNSEGWYGSGPDDRALRLTGADHCDFESPTDALCTAFCAGGSADDATVSQIVFSMTAAFAVWQSGLDPDGELWWTPGEPWYDLVATAATEL